MATQPSAASALPDGVTPAFTTDQAAIYTGLAPKTLERMRCTGRGPRFVSFSRNAVRYLKADLDAWLSSLTIASTSERKAA